MSRKDIKQSRSRVAQTVGSRTLCLKIWEHLRLFINPELLKTAAFLVVNGEADSTLFFVKLYNHVHYAVTASHAVKNRTVSIRFNLTNGGTEAARNVSAVASQTLRPPLVTPGKELLANLHHRCAEHVGLGHATAAGARSYANSRPRKHAVLLYLGPAGGTSFEHRVAVRADSALLDLQ